MQERNCLVPMVPVTGVNNQPTTIMADLGNEEMFEGFIAMKDELRIHTLQILSAERAYERQNRSLVVIVQDLERVKVEMGYLRQDYERQGSILVQVIQELETLRAEFKEYVSSVKPNQMML